MYFFAVKISLHLSIQVDMQADYYHVQYLHIIYNRDFNNYYDNYIRIRIRG